MKNAEFDPASDSSLLDTQSPASNALTEFLQSTVYTAIQAPARGLAQIVDHACGTKSELAIQDAFKQVHIEEPKPNKFGTDRWYAQQLGNACGMILPLVLLRGAAKGVGSALLDTELSKGSSNCISKFAMDTSAKALAGKEVLLSGFVGGAYGGLLTPTDPSHVGKQDFFSDRFKHGSNDMLLFSTLGLTNHAAGSALSKLANAVESKGLSVGLATTLPAVLRSPFVSGAVSGVPAGIACAELGAWSNGQRFATQDQLKESVVAMSFIGGAFGAASDFSRTDGPRLATKPERKLEVKPESESSLETPEPKDASSVSPTTSKSAEVTVKKNALPESIESLIAQTDREKAQSWREQMFSTDMNVKQSETVNSDGSRMILWENGFNTIDYPDGSSYYFAPDGTFVLEISRLPSNRRMERWGDGIVDIRTKNGSLLESKDPDGSSCRFETPEKGLDRRIERDSEGRETIYETYRFKQGERRWIDSIKIRPDGSKSVKYVSWDEYHQRPDGTGEFMVRNSNLDDIGFPVGAGEVKFEFDRDKGISKFSCSDGTEIESSSDYYSWKRPDGRIYTKTKEKTHTVFPDGKEEHDYKDGVRFVDNGDGTGTLKNDDGTSQTLGLRKIIANDDYFVFYEQGANAAQLFKSIKFFDTKYGKEETEAKMYRANEFLKKPESVELMADMPRGCVPLGFGHLRFAFLSPSGDVLCIGPNVERPPCPALLQAKDRKVYGRYQVETLPYADHNISEAEMDALRSQFIQFSETDKQHLAPSEWLMIDSKIENVGRLADGRIVVIDPDCMNLVDTPHWVPLLDNRKIEISYRRAIDALLREGNATAAANMYKRLAAACLRQGRHEQAEMAYARAKELKLSP
jgi:hypothetical protein